MNSKLSIIAAISENRGIGKDNKLLFHIKKDLSRFKKITLGHPVVMGRKTFESIGRPLPKRINIIVTRNKSYQIKDNFVFHSLKQAIDFAKTKTKKEIFIIGGADIYKQAIGLADKLYLTIVKAKPGADAFFPQYSSFKKIIFKKECQSEGYQYTFLELEKAV